MIDQIVSGGCMLATAGWFTQHGQASCPCLHVLCFSNVTMLVIIRRSGTGGVMQDNGAYCGALGRLCYMQRSRGSVNSLLAKGRQAFFQHLLPCWLDEFIQHCGGTEAKSRCSCYHNTSIIHRCLLMHM